jgi:hypothetical protein
MKRTTTTIMCVVVCAVMALLGARHALACQVDEFYLTKGGVLAASTPEILNAAARYEQEGNKEKIAELMKNGTVLRLAENIKVQALEWSFEFKTLKIKIPDKSDAYWVGDGSLKQIECK